MKYLLVNHLRDHGPMRLGQLHAEFSRYWPGVQDLLATLKRLRSEGRLYAASSLVDPLWHYGENFVCSACSRGFPEVIRAGDKTQCRDCLNAKRRKPRREPRAEIRRKSNYTQTRFNDTDIDDWWAGPLANDWARRSICG